MAVDYKNCPAYWQNIGTSKVMAITKGEGVEIPIFDTCVFEPHFAFKRGRVVLNEACLLNMASSNAGQPLSEHVLRYNHGTAVSGAMIGRYNNCTDVSTNKFSGEVSCGIAPRASVRVFTNSSFYQKVQDYSRHYKLENSSYLLDKSVLAILCLVIF